MLFLCYLKQSKIIYILFLYNTKVLYKSSCFLLFGVESRDFSHVEKKNSTAKNQTTCRAPNSTYLTEFIENQGWVSRKFHFFSTDKGHTAAICHMCQKLSFLHVSTIHISQWTVLCMYFTTSTLELNVNFNVCFYDSINGKTC